MFLFQAEDQQANPDPLHGQPRTVHETQKAGHHRGKLSNIKIFFLIFN